MATQKLGATTAEEPFAYTSLGVAVAITDRRVLLTALGLPGFSSGTVYVYDWSAGSLVATHKLEKPAGYGSSLALVGNTAFVGFPENSSTFPEGEADVYNLPPAIP